LKKALRAGGLDPCKGEKWRRLGRKNNALLTKGHFKNTAKRHGKGEKGKSSGLDAESLTFAKREREIGIKWSLNWGVLVGLIRGKDKSRKGKHGTSRANQWRTVPRTGSKKKSKETRLSDENERLKYTGTKGPKTFYHKRKDGEEKKTAWNRKSESSSEEKKLITSEGIKREKSE